MIFLPYKNSPQDIWFWYLPGFCPSVSQPSAAGSLSVTGQPTLRNPREPVFSFAGQRMIDLSVFYTKLPHSSRWKPQRIFLSERNVVASIHATHQVMFILLHCEAVRAIVFCLAVMATSVPKSTGLYLPGCLALLRTDLHPIHPEHCHSTHQNKFVFLYSDFKEKQQ